MKCYRKNGSDLHAAQHDLALVRRPSMKCYRKNGSDKARPVGVVRRHLPSMKCYRKNGSDLLIALPCRS